jgi:energy-coupling factor transporter ATP-binding protein EcfA2
VIEAHGLTKRYGPITAVDQLSFDVRPGVVTGFLGPNGSGKSTTMRLILGLDAADHGMVKVAGELVTFAGFLAGAAFVHGAVPRPALSQPDVLRAVVLSGVYLCLVGLIGLALGVIVRHGAAAITALVALVFVAPLAGLAATPAGQYLPELIYANALGATKPVQGFTLSPWAGLAIIVAYVVVLLSAGGWLLTRRDA